jgi:hypothetical protein
MVTTYRPTIFETHGLSLYSHLCIYIATHQDSISELAAGGVCELMRAAPENDDTVNSE